MFQRFCFFTDVDLVLFGFFAAPDPDAAGAAATIAALSFSFLFFLAATVISPDARGS